jgi:hypothetical protein
MGRRIAHKDICSTREIRRLGFDVSFRVVSYFVSHSLEEKSEQILGKTSFEPQR